MQGFHRAEVLQKGWEEATERAELPRVTSLGLWFMKFDSWEWVCPHKVFEDLS